MENSSPNPSFSICDIQIQKQMSRSFGKSFPQKIALPKLRPHCSATCPNTWRAEPQKEKCPFHFQKKLVARKSEKQGTFFIFGVAGVLASAWGFLRIICFESRFELGTINTPIQNSTAFSKPEGGTREARPTDFPPIFPNEFRIFGALARTDFSPRRRFEPKISLAQTFFAKRSESEAILTHSICLIQKEFLLL